VDTKRRFASYVVSRLIVEKETEHAAVVRDATAQIVDAGHALEAEEAVLQERVAARDACEDVMDDRCRSFRQKLAATSLDAVHQPPYRGVFPEGIAYYVAAPLDQQAKRCRELGARVTEHLPADDALRVELLPALDAFLAQWAVVAQQVEAQQTVVAQARTRLAMAEDAWARALEKVYGALLTEHGKKEAERFFPRSTRARRAGGGEGPDVPSEG
jgi:hypothetical protein